MNTIEAALHHLVLPPKGDAVGPYPTLLLLHGRGANEEDLLGLSSFLDPRLMIISVRAPYPFPYGGGFTWYDVGHVGTPDPAMFRSSFEKLSAFVADAVARYPVDGNRLYVLGFSMGTVMSYALALTQPGLFRAVVANSGYIAEGTHLSYQWNRLEKTEFFVAHGTQDPVIPVHFGRHAKELLESAHARFEYREYPMAHEISEESLQDVSRWLTNRIHPAA